MEHFFRHREYAFYSTKGNKTQNVPFSVAQSSLRYAETPTGFYRGSMVQQTHMSSQGLNTVNCAGHTSPISSVGNIPVHYTGNCQTANAVNMVEELESFVHNAEEFLQYVKRKPKRFYLGGFKPEITHDKIKKYVQRWDPTVTWLCIWPSRRNDNNVVIRLNVEDKEYADWVTSPTFWPRGVRCRPWVDKRGNGSD